MKLKQVLVVAGLSLGLGFASCNSGSMRRNPGKTYAPDMTYSQAYDYYNESPNFADGHAARMPVVGTVARGHELPDHLIEGDTNAYKTFSTTKKFSEADLTEGKRLFNIYCGICHGTNLDGNGPLYASGKFAAMPANLKDAKYLNMPVGQIYAAIKYGKNAMGSYASQLDIHQRWMVIAYIKKFQSENGGAAYTMGVSKADSAAAAKTPAPSTDTVTSADPANESAHGAAH